MDNPFRYSGPVSGDDLCGRRPLLADLETAAARGRPVAVAGPPGSGVSSVAAELERRLRGRGAHAVRADLTPELGPRSAGDAVISALAGVGARGAAASLRGPSAGKPDAGTRPPDGGGPAGEPVPRLLLDRAHRLAEEGFAGLRHRLGKAATAGQVVPVYLATRPSALEDALRGTDADPGSARGPAGGGSSGDPGPPRLRVTALHRIGPVPLAAWLPYVLERFLETDRWISNEHVEAAVSSTRGHPSSVQHLLHVLWSGIDAGERVEAGVTPVEDALRIVLGREAGTIDRQLEALTPNQRRTLAGIAREGPEVQPYSSGFVRRSELASPASVQRALQALAAAELVGRSPEAGRDGEADGGGGGIRVTDPLLEALLRRRFDL